ncbi:MAG: hypothetical protein AB7T37_17660 [Dehalococcoidia bacterium]
MTEDAPQRARPAMRNPETMDFPTGPAEGELLPAATLPDQRGELVSFGGAGDGRRTYLAFIRATVW